MDDSAPALGSARAWHALAPDTVLAALDTRASGLTAAEAARRLARDGRNELPPPPRRPAWRRFLAQFDNLLIYVLLAAALVTLALGQAVDTAAIVGVVLI
ncbi:MAG: cation-transporting P-type ATPase, partial [Burkholderiaceae bacterium]|nr:cation-transporting P-type ATPase [Burkholderiaceae bacterium]